MSKYCRLVFLTLSVITSGFVFFFIFQPKLNLGFGQIQEIFAGLKSANLTTSQDANSGKNAITAEGGHWNHKNTSQPQFDPVYTSDHWPVFSKNYFLHPIPRSPYIPKRKIHWDYNTTAFLQRPEVKGQPPKLMTWMVKTRYTPPLPEPVRLRVCPEMPCRMTTNASYRMDSAILMWAGQIITANEPPPRSHPDQVFLLHNDEPQNPYWFSMTSIRKPAWKSAFNWTMTYRLDSDIVHLHGKISKRQTPVNKNYTAIMAQKDGLAVQMVSNCQSMSKREEYVKRMRKYASVDIYGLCSKLHCGREKDEECFEILSRRYKFYLAFESSFCKDYITEKFFRYMDGDFVVVARGSNDYKNHAPDGTFINAADFRSPEDLAKHLAYLDKHPEEYLKILKAKDQYEPLYEDWPIRSFPTGKVDFMTYHYMAVAWCETCRRLWDLEKYRSTIPDINSWLDKYNCYQPNDLA